MKNVVVSNNVHFLKNSIVSNQNVNFEIKVSLQRLPKKAEYKYFEINLHTEKKPTLEKYLIINFKNKSR